MLFVSALIVAAQVVMAPTPTKADGWHPDQPYDTLFAKTATFIIFATPEEGIGFPLSGMGWRRDLTSCREGGG